MDDLTLLSQLIPCMDKVNNHIRGTRSNKSLKDLGFCLEIHMNSDDIWVTFLGNVIWSKANDDRKWCTGNYEPLEPFLIKRCQEQLTYLQTIRKLSRLVRTAKHK